MELMTKIRAGEDVVWVNPGILPFEDAKKGLSFQKADICEARERMERFSPFLMEAFPELLPTRGIIESPLQEIAACKDKISSRYPVPEGRLFMKLDSDLAVAGSVKARGGIHEVLRHAEELAMEAGMITREGDYKRFLSPEFQQLFRAHKVQVGSTGNLGISIGVMSAKLGFEVIVHMSMDAKQWKKDLLRSHGVQVIEYASDYGRAVEMGRKSSDEDPLSYFVDDEHSSALYLGYAVAGERLKKQLEEQNITIDDKHPLFVYLPCGVGGAPGGITFGLKEAFGDFVHCIFVEPTQTPCMLLGLATGMREKISIGEVGLSGKTVADGLAVGRCSGLVAKEMEHLLSSVVTVRDQELFPDMRDLEDSEGIFIEPSSCAAFAGYRGLREAELRRYCEEHGLDAYAKDTVHVLWATGGSLVPEEVRADYRKQ